MMTALVLAAVVLAVASVPFLMVAVNLPAFRRSPRRGATAPVSLLIPARNERDTIGRALEAALRSDHPEFEIIVMDDDSDDGTEDVVRAAAARDPRVRLEQAPPLPAGWCGKQHACAALARAARHDVFVFCDADVTLAPDALSRIVAELERGGRDLVSGFPRQLTGTLLERLLLPLIHFVLLGFLPLPAMRRSADPAFAAGCGQLFCVRREAYERAGGHGAIRGSRHDGITLPRAFRRAGRSTDVFDATDVASCRMYRNAREVWSGLAKNAHEGMATPAAIGPWTVLLGVGQVAPPVLLAVFLLAGAAPAAIWLAVAAVACGATTRVALALRFRQSLLGAALHPAGVALLLAIQWRVVAGGGAGRAVPWKGRLA